MPANFEHHLQDVVVTATGSANVVALVSARSSASAGAQPVGLCLSVAEWLQRALPAPDFLMGEWLSSTSRAMLVAPTGLGKTNLCMALAFAIDRKSNSLTSSH